ncbi:MAG: hypothetical protein ACE5JF_10060 [Anaerolineales bacterium]
MTLPVLAVGLLLAFLPPVLPLNVPWRLVLLVTVPLILWQGARRLVNADWWNIRVELALWGFASLLFAVPFVLVGSLGVLSALLLGMLLGSILWRAGEGEESPSFVSQIGPLTLIFLLVETAPQVESPNRYLGGVASGLAIGIAIAAAATWLVGRVSPRWQDVIALGQVYLAFTIGDAIEISAVATALASVVAYFILAVRSNLWQGGKMRPAPLNSWPGFLALLAIFIVLGWQTHRPLTVLVAVEVLVGVTIGLSCAVIGRRLGIPVFLNSGSIAVVGARVALLVLAALLLWPREELLGPLPLGLALSAAAVSLFLATSVLPTYLPQSIE